MHKSVQYGILAVIVASPLAFGSVEPWAYSLIDLFGFLLLLVWTFNRLFMPSPEGSADPKGMNGRPGEPIEPAGWLRGRERSARQNRMTLYLLSAFIGLVVLQLVPLPVPVVRLLSPARINFIEKLHLGAPSAVTLSANPYLTSIALLNFMGLLVYFFLITRLLASPTKQANKPDRPNGKTDQTTALNERPGMFQSLANSASSGFRRVAVRNLFLKKLTLTLIATGFLVALFGIIQKLSGAQEIYWIRKLTHGGSLMGPFVNRDHFAGYIEMTFGVTLGLLLFLKRQAGYRWLLGLAAVLMGAAMLYSGSRGGIVCFLFELVCAGILLFAFRPEGSIRLKKPENPLTSGLVIPILLLAVIAAISWIGPEAVLGRLNEDASQNDRLPVWRDTWAIVKSFPIFGSGLGTFRSVFPHYQSKDFPVQFLQAHNDYMQLLSETGILGAGMILIALATLGYRPFRERRSSSRQILWPENRERRGSLKEGHHFSRAARLGALIGICGMLLHSCFDFNLQIPSNALLFTTLCAVVSG
ncbi:MAG: O-antigen ligase family protein [Acidobacteriia bacterium]|nr:O-antigen ligase family protein [Terriglobia bacterium]